MDLLLKLIKFGDGSLDEIREMIDGIRRLRGAESTADQIRIALDLLKILARLSPTDVDDQILAAIERIATDELIEGMVNLVERLLGNTASAMTTEMHIESIDYFEAQGVNFFQAIALAKMIAQLIKLARQSTQP